MNMEFGFAHPWNLLLLLALAAVVWARRRSGRRGAFLYSSVNLVKSIVGLQRGGVGQALDRLRWVSLALFVAALARPQLAEGEAKVKSSGVDIVVALDLSGSMAAEDFQLNGRDVNRLVIAKDVIGKFVEKRSSDRIGLVVFAGGAYVAAPLTLDHDYLLENLERVDLGLIEDGTAIGSGISAALNRLKDLQAKSKLIILMTDGQNNAGKVPPKTAAEAAKALEVRVYTIGVGTKGMARIPYTDPFGRKQYATQQVDIDEDTLKDVASTTGGKYFRAENTEGLIRIYDEIDQLEKTEVEVKRYQHYTELFPWLILAGLVFLLVETILAHTVWRRLP